MNKILFTTLFITIAVTSVFGYFFYRDVYSTIKVQASELSCVPVDLSKSIDSEGVLQLSWRVAEKCKSYVVYGQSPDDASFISVPDKFAGNQMKVEIEDLKPGHTYYFYVYSEDQIYGYKGSPIVVKVDNANL